MNERKNEEQTNININNNKKYKIRYLDIIPYMEDNKQIFIIRDPFSYTDQTLALEALGYVVILELNGKNTIKDIQEKILKEYKVKIELNQIAEIIRVLDKEFFLDNDRFYDYKNKIENNFKKEKIRKPTHSNISYPENPEKIISLFDSFFNNDFGHKRASQKEYKPIGIIAPHIDIRVGGKIYADAYRELLPYINQYERFIILGTSHIGPKNMFSLTKKDFDTPLGNIETDKNFVDEINKSLSFDALEDEFVHKSEHSIEFQTVFLKYLQEKHSLKPFKIVPILFGSFMEFAYQNKLPEDTEDFNNLISAINRLKDDKTCIIASVDLAHIGKKFGDKEGLSKDFLEYVNKADKSMIEHIKNGDKNRFWDSIVSEKDKRKICGFSPIYTFLSLIKDRKARISSYDKNIEEYTESMVSYASIVF